MEQNVLRSLKSNQGVQEAFWVNGAYDIVVKVKAETFDILRDTLARIKKSLPKMQSMVTMLIIERSAISEQPEKNQQ